MKYQETLDFHFGIPDPDGSFTGMDHSSSLRLQQLNHDRSEEFSRAFY
jgi:hypothetical protein